MKSKTQLGQIDPKKCRVYELITGKSLKKLTRKGKSAILQIFNAVGTHSYFPYQCKAAAIIMIPKPGKNSYEFTSYKPITLLPILSKIFDKLLLKRLKQILLGRKLIHHQYGFRRQHGTVKQVHHVVKQISNDLEQKILCCSIY